MLQLLQWTFRSWIEVILIVGDADGVSRLEGGVIVDMLAGCDPARAPSVIRNDAPGNHPSTDLGPELALGSGDTDRLRAVRLWRVYATEGALAHGFIGIGPW